MSTVKKITGSLFELEKNSLKDEVCVTETGCMGSCDIGPVMLVYPDGVFYTKLSADDIPEIVNSHFINGSIKLDKTYYDRKTESYIPYINDIDYFKAQVKIALKNCGNIAYSSLEEFIANDGYGYLPFGMRIEPGLIILIPSIS